MRTLQIGDRKLSDMKPDEFVDFIYDFGYCASSEFWNKPILTQFEYDKSSRDDIGSVYFKFFQLRKDDGKRIEKTGHIFFGDGKTDYNTKMGMYVANDDENFSMATHYTFDMKAINHFLKTGFDLPLYSK